MKILVANLGSTSFKYRLFDMTDSKEMARGAVDRIGQQESRALVEIGGTRHERTEHVADHAAALRACLAQLANPNAGCLESAADVSAIGFKAVHGGGTSGVVRVTPEVLANMESVSDVAPAHNPPYVAAMRLVAESLPEIPLVAAFETGFHDTIPAANRTYAIPREWTQSHGVRRWGFHGASHRYIARRTRELFDRDSLRVISCHLGGSSSLCAIRDGQSVATSMGMSPQTGLPHNNRCGDFDPFALPVILRATGLSLEDALDQLANRSGLLGVSGTSGDVRDLEAQAADGDERAKLAIGVFVAAARHYLGAYLVELGGADAIVFTGGIGENSALVRGSILDGLSELGIELDQQKNQSTQGEASIGTAASRTQVWVIPTNEELVVANQTRELLEG